MNIEYIKDGKAKRFFLTNENEIREMIESVQKEDQLINSGDTVRVGIGVKNQKLSFIVYKDRVETMNKEIETKITDKYFFFKQL